MKCESCGGDDFRGNRCVRCGAPRNKRIGRRGLAIAAVIVLIISVVYISMVFAYQPERTKIKNIGSGSNNRYVYIEGTIVEADLNKEKYQDTGMFAMDVYDGTGVIYVKMTEATSESMVKDGNIPAVGMEFRGGGKFYGGEPVTVEFLGREIAEASGIIKVTGEDRAEIVQPKYEEMTVSDVYGAGMEDIDPGQPIKVSGTVSDFFQGDWGMILKIKERSNELSVFVPRYIMDLASIPDTYQIGAEVEIKGGAQWYQDYWEVVAHHIEITTGVEYEDLALEDLLNQLQVYNNTNVNVSGPVTSIDWDTSYGGERYTKRFEIGQGNQTLWVYIEDWDDRITELGNETRVTAAGNFQWYEGGGYWEIVVRGGSADHITTEVAT